MIEIHESIGRPQASPKVFPGDDFTGTLEEHGQDLKGLLLEANLETVSAKLASAKVYLKGSKADSSVYTIPWHLAVPTGLPS
jgi:hypothetical protein